MTATIPVTATAPVVGMTTAPRPGRSTPARHWTAAVPRWWATVLGVMSAICAVTAIIPPLARALEPVLSWLNIYTLRSRPT